MPRPLHIVDVFAEQAYGGNPLAVVLEADGLSDETMQRVAAEMNYSETTFVTTAPRDGAFRVRIFTPARELAFAGHPILGTAWVIRNHIAPGRNDPMHLEIGAGRIPITFERSADGREVAWFAAPPVLPGPTCAREPIAAALGIPADELDTRFPVQQLAARTSAMIVPLLSLKALRRAHLDLDAFAPLAAVGFPSLVYLFCRETHDPRNDLCARFFFEAHGVREDPATGNGAAFLGAYLLEHRVYGESDLSLRIEQGHEVRRPSLVLLRARKVGASRDVSIGGRVIHVVRGELLSM